MKAPATPRMAGTRVEGSTKFGWTPGGGAPAGCVFSTAKGMLSRTFGSTVPVDIIMITREFPDTTEEILVT